MKSSRLGKNISEIEILNVGPKGIWLFVKGKEFFLSYQQYPWFKDAKLADILHIELCGEHLHWPRLDVDLEIDSLENPEKYPLIAKK